MSKNLSGRMKDTDLDTESQLKTVYFINTNTALFMSMLNVNQTFTGWKHCGCQPIKANWSAN